MAVETGPWSTTTSPLATAMATQRPVIPQVLATGTAATTSSPYPISK
ncbi:hypothetical protein [Nonomuraea sp. JJY05]